MALGAGLLRPLPRARLLAPRRRRWQRARRAGPARGRARVEGVELSRRSADRARRILADSGLHATIHTAAIEDWTPSGRYDAIVFSWYCYSFIPVAKRRVEILAKLRERLLPGGRILISYLPHREDYAGSHDRRVAHVAHAVGLASGAR